MAKNNNVSSWTGWVAFAATLLILVGFFHIVTGLVGLFNYEIFVVGPENVRLVNYTKWDWAHILWGVLSVWAGSSLAKGNMFGRIVAVVVAMTSAMASLAFVPVYPIWSILFIAIDICVIYAVTVHGKEMKELQ